MNRQPHARILGLVFLSVGFLTSCNNSDFNTPIETVAATSGTPQTAALNTAFAAPLVATVTMGGSPVSGAFVIFTAPATGASGTFASSSSNTETDTTNAMGVATSSAFTANGTIGADVVTASVAGVTATTSFNLTNTSGPPASIAATSGSLQDAQVSTAFGAPLVATVVDANQNPVSGASVTFAAPATGASGAFASNSSNTETDTTNASGQATSSAFTADATAGAYTVTATVTGVATAANFQLTNITGALISIAATNGTPQSAPVLANFSAQLVATVLDGNQNPVSGVLVTFEVPAAGPGGTFAGGMNTAKTNASGVATSATFTANGSAGTYTVTATVASGAEPANFILTNTALNFSFYVSGLESVNGPGFYALAGAVTLDGNGNVLGGEQDYNDGNGLASPEPSPDTILPGTGALTVNPVTGQGTLTLTTNNTGLGASGVETLAVQFVNTNHALIVQFDGSATSSGSMDLQTLSSALNDGNYAFTLSGTDSALESTVFGGVFSISNSGTALAGTFDVDDAGAATTPTLGIAFSGTITAPDAFGRGTISSAALGISLNYYMVAPEAIRIIDVDNSDSGVGSAFGQGAGIFGNASLGSSVFGVESNSSGNLYAAAGMFTTNADSGTFTGIADDDEYDNDTIVPAAPISGNYTVAANGYGSLTITPGDLGDVSVLGIYMTDPLLNLSDPNNTTSGLGGALIADLDGANPTGALNGTGVLIPQTDTSSASFAGRYAFGAQTYYTPDRPDEIGWEFDFVGRASVEGGALSNTTGLVSDPFAFFNATQSDGTDTANFSGTAVPDPVNAGRYTISKFGIAVAADPVNFNTIIYQASGGQLFWLDEDENDESVFFGSLQQQGSLSALPAVQRSAAKAKSRQ
ncbi:MAG: beta strand repeat-containing protein [Candidatus Sulfotelmatobacter sp.]